MSDDNEATNDHNVTSITSINDSPKQVPPPANEQKILTEVSTLQSVVGDIHLWRMRWFILIILGIGFLGAIAASIIIRNPIPLALAYLMRPTIRWLFPPESPGKENMP